MPRLNSPETTVTVRWFTQRRAVPGDEGRWVSITALTTREAAREVAAIEPADTVRVLRKTVTTVTHYQLEED
jgi:hypothetical protein